MDTNNLNLGKLRGLAQCASDNGTFCILALDHRQAVVKALARHGERAFEESVAFKKDVIQALAPHASAFLLDPVIGAAPAVISASLPGTTGLIVTVEESGYAGASHARVSRLPEHWNVEKTKRMGASAVKLLVYYHPRAQTAAAMQEFVAQVWQDCQRFDIPLFLEILTYSASPEGAAMTGGERREVILRTVEELAPLGGDILKVEFPAGTGESRQAWEDACRSVTQASCIPWVLLSAGVDSDVFLEQTAAACAGGASGILAGRAIWKEALSLDGAERQSFLQETAQSRLRQLADLCAASGTPYTGRFPAPAVSQDWQRQYPGF